MKKLLVVSFIFTLLWSFGGIVTDLSVARGETSRSKAVGSKNQKVSQASPRTPESTCSTDGCAHLREGRELLERGEYDDSIEKLKTAYKELPVVGDYALFFMAKAYERKKEFDDSNAGLNEILRKYPDSLLRKKARALLIKNDASMLEISARDDGWSDIMKSIEKYVADYPEDVEMRFLFGKVLKKAGEKEQARKVFRQVYAANSSLSDYACGELEPSDITADDMLAKASNYIKDTEYKKAETLLRKALAAAGDRSRDDIMKKLGLALFRQKRYRDAAAEFSRAGDIYNAARSLYRAGDLDAFSSTLAELISMEDRRAGSLLIALAAKKRREGKTEEALKIYEDVGKAYPSLAEEALWGTAWTCYRRGEYEKASNMLTELNKAHPNTRYLYWKARCTNTPNEDRNSPEAGSPPTLLKGDTRKDFYALLSEMHEKDLTGLSHVSVPPEVDAGNNESCVRSLSGLAGGGQDPAQNVPNASARKNPVLARSLERFVILMSIGLREDAMSELVSRSGEFSNPDVLLYLGQILKEVGAYKNAIALISRLSKHKDAQGKSEMSMDDILYPLAYWPIVENVTRGHNLDPFLLLSVMREESRFDPEARSVAGAIGLMQIMPQTAGSLTSHAVKTASEMYDVKTNIAIGAYYLNLLIKEFGSLPVAIAAYNAGEEKVREWLKQGPYRSFDEFIEDIPYDETRTYVRKVLTTYYAYKQRVTKNPADCAKKALQ